VAWVTQTAPDGGDGDIRTGLDFYWTATFRGIHTRHEVFYFWTLPVDTQHMTDTNAPEEFMLDPEDVDLLPMQVQDGETDWTILDPPEDN
jgi:hypothetical protein